jgi:hypothetical protein
VDAYYQLPKRPVISVKWPFGGWIIWNWLTNSWDDMTDEERTLVKQGEASAATNSPPQEANR